MIRKYLSRTWHGLTAHKVSLDAECLAPYGTRGDVMVYAQCTSCDKRLANSAMFSMSRFEWACHRELRHLVNEL